MVEDFQYFTDGGSSLYINLGIDVYMFEGNDESLISNFYKNQSKGVRWVYKNQMISFFEKGNKIYGIPTPDLMKVVVIYPMQHTQYSSPRNVVIYNADGSMYCRPKIPELISEIAKKREDFHKGNFALVHFDNVRWRKNSKGEIVTAITISFDRDWFETREFNVETCEFSECLTSGRR